MTDLVNKALGILSSLLPWCFQRKVHFASLLQSRFQASHLETALQGQRLPLSMHHPRYQLLVSPISLQRGWLDTLAMCFQYIQHHLPEARDSIAEASKGSTKDRILNVLKNNLSKHYHPPRAHPHLSSPKFHTAELSHPTRLPSQKLPSWPPLDLTRPHVPRPLRIHQVIKARCVG